MLLRYAEGGKMQELGSIQNAGISTHVNNSTLGKAAQDKGGGSRHTKMVPASEEGTSSIKAILALAGDSAPNTGAGTTADEPKSTRPTSFSELVKEADSADTQCCSFADLMVDEADKSLEEVLSQAAEQIVADPAASLQAQANVPPETALHLLGGTG